MDEQRLREIEVTTRIWRAHALPPLTGGDLVAAILRRSGRYYNKLVEIERARAERFAEIRRELAPELGALEDEYERLDDRAREIVRAIKRARQEHWRRTKGEASLLVPEDLEVELERVQAEKKRVSAEAKPLRRAFAARLEPDAARYKSLTTERAAGGGPRIRERINAEVLKEMLADPATDEAWRRVRESDARALAAAKAARAACGLPPGTYLTIEQAFDRAKKDAAPRAPRFKAHRGEGKIAVQLRHTTVADVLAGASQHFTLTPDPKPGRKGKSEQHYLARIRVGSDGRAPVWATFPVRMHRMPPADAAVKWAWITVRRQGERMRYELQLVLEHESFGVAKRPAGIGDGGHVRLGWSQTADGVLVAMWDDGELVVPRRMIERALRAETLISHADRHYDAICRVLRFVGVELPPHMRRWRMALRRVLVDFARHVFGADAARDLWRAWREQRLDAGLDLFCGPAEASRWLRAHGHTDAQARLAWWCFIWTKKDQHLRQWSADARRGFENARDALFRETAIRLATQYETISIDSYSVAQMKMRPRPLTRPGEAPNEVAQHNAHLAAPGRFREILLEVMGPRCTPRERPGDREETGGARKRRKRKDHAEVSGRADGERAESGGAEAAE